MTSTNDGALTRRWLAELPQPGREAIQRQTAALLTITLPDDLAQLVREHRLPVADALAIERGRGAREAQRRYEERQTAEREAENARWRARQDEEKRMAPTWARYILAHTPALGDAVVHRDFPIREAVKLIQEQTGCPLNCDHRPLVAAQVDALYAIAGDEDKDKADHILRYAAEQVPQVIAAAVDDLIATGRVVRHEDGTVTAVEQNA